VAWHDKKQVAPEVEPLPVEENYAPGTAPPQFTEATRRAVRCFLAAEALDEDDPGYPAARYAFHRSLLWKLWNTSPLDVGDEVEDGDEVEEAAGVPAYITGPPLARRMRRKLKTLARQMRKNGEL
jgi:hypothetical protein